MTTSRDAHDAGPTGPGAPRGALTRLVPPVLRPLAEKVLSPEVLTFLLVGGAGYVVDVAVFNQLLGTAPFSGWDPSVARVVAVAVATVVTYAGNRLLTWRGRSRHGRRREVLLFALFNALGLGISVLTLVVSHDLLGLTSRLADNVSANVVGLALGTAFRFWSYRTFVFAPEEGPDRDTAAAPGTPRAEHLQSVA